MITALAQAISQFFSFLNTTLNQDETRRFNTATQQAQTDVQNFKNDLLARRLDDVNLRLAGLQHGILIHLSDAESRELQQLDPHINAATLLGLYARARAADLAADHGDIALATFPAAQLNTSPGAPQPAS